MFETDKEILDYFSKASQQVCGRFSNDQLNKEMTATPVKKRVTWLYMWNLILASLLMTKTYAQGKPQICPCAGGGSARSKRDCPG